MERELGLLTVSAPVYNEGEGLQAFYERVRDALEGLNWELVLVDDGSTDNTHEVLDRLAAEDPRVRVVFLSRNFGYQPAVAAGLDHARGDAVVTIDSDLQDPPEVIPDLVQRWREGDDVVYAVRETREGETWLKLFTAKWFSRLFRKVSHVKSPENVGDFRLMDRRAVDAIKCMKERRRFMRGMSVWVGYRQGSVPYRRKPRSEGDTKYNWGTLLRISFDAITSFSTVPLQIATLIGAVCAAIAFAMIPLVVIGRFFDQFALGIPSVLVAVLMLGGMQLLALGIIGEYVGRIYDEVKQRPLYLVQRRLNVDRPEAPVKDMEAVR